MTMANDGRSNARDPLPAQAGRGALTPSKQSEIVGALKVCGSIRTACVACGVPWGTASDWLRKGKQGVAPYDAFFAAMQETKAQRNVVLDSYILKAAREGSWQAAAALRDRRSATQKARDKMLRPVPTGDEAMVLVYPVAVAEGAELSQLALPPGHAIDTEGTSVPEPAPPAGDEGDDDFDDE